MIRFIVFLCVLFTLTCHVNAVCMANSMRQFLLGEYARMARLQSVSENNILCVIKAAQQVPYSYIKDGQGVMRECVEEQNLSTAVLSKLGECYDELEPLSRKSTDRQQKVPPSRQAMRNKLSTRTTNDDTTIHSKAKASKFDPNCYSGRHSCCTVIGLNLASKCFSYYCPYVPERFLCFN